MTIRFRRGFAQVVVLGAFGAMLAACAVLPQNTPSVSHYQGLPYVDQGHERQVADLYVPMADQPLAAVIVIHGGGWSRGEPEDMRKHVQRFVDQGYAVMNISYRLAPEFQHPAQVNDVLAAHRWLVNSAKHYNIDPQRIAVMGYSAGAHLAMMLGLRQGSDLPPIKAVVAGGGPMNVQIYPQSPYLLKLIGANGYDAPLAYQDASPVSHVSSTAPPTLLYHGGWDRLVEFEQSQMMAQQLDRAGVEWELVELPWLGHISAFVFDGKAWEAMREFLARHLQPQLAKDALVQPAAFKPGVNEPALTDIWL